MRQVILDTETTGLEHSQGHRILEIACVEMIDRKVSAPDRHLHLYINPERDSDEGALRVHGLTTEFLADKPRFANVASQFIEFIRGAELIIHNAPFDLGFLNAELARLSLGKVNDYVAGVIDTLAMAKDIYPGKRNNLDALCDRLEVDRSARILHGALIDCELLGEVYLAMTRGQESLLMDLVGADDSTIKVTSRLPRTERKALKVLRSSDSELEAHEAYLRDLDKAVKGECVWRQYEPLPGGDPV